MQQEQQLQEQQLSCCLMEQRNALGNYFEQESPNIIHKISPITNLGSLNLHDDNDSLQHSHEILDINIGFPHVTQLNQEIKTQKINIITQVKQQQNHEGKTKLISCRKNNADRTIKNNIVDELLEDSNFVKNEEIQPNNLKTNIKQLYKRQTRKDKIQRYLQKKEKRIWTKKISYYCRKKVADNRVRVNGKFVKQSINNSFSHIPKIKIQYESSPNYVKIEENYYDKKSNKINFQSSFLNSSS